MTTEQAETTRVVTQEQLVQAWPGILERLAAEVGSREGARKVRVWLGSNRVRPAGLDGGILILECPTNLFVMQIRENFAQRLSGVVGECLGCTVASVECRVSGPAFRQHRARLAAQSAPDEEDLATDEMTVDDHPQRTKRALNRTFGHGFKVLRDFVVGRCNRHAYDAVNRLLKEPESPINPLFIHGSSGLGKTHLEQGLGVAFKERFPHSNAIYMSCEQFRNAYLAACERSTVGLQAFRMRMRHADLLLIDDIHFLSRGQMVQTKEELFWTINELMQKGKLVVITSDAHPSDIKYLEDRFVQRFAGGLVVRLEPPDLQVRREVVLAKALQRERSLPAEVVEFVAAHITDNIRELEGAVNKLIAFADSFERHIDLVSARQALSDSIKRDSSEPRLKLILRAVADHFDLTAEDILGRGRSGPRSTARHIAMYVFKESGADTYAGVGQAFGVKSHSSVAYACEQALRCRASDPDLARFVDDLLARVRG